MSPERARALPVRTALSGPAAGAIGAAHSAKLSGRRNVITLDMGGTSADVALIRNFQADISFERDVAGFSVRLPAVDIEDGGSGRRLDRVVRPRRAAQGGSGERGCRSRPGVLRGEAAASPR